jgi:chromosome partitioning protein
MFACLGYGMAQVKMQPNIGNDTKLIPDYLIYDDLDRTPSLVVEIKKRDSSLLEKANKTDFVTVCEENALYREAVGFPNLSKPNNGILQYLDVTKVSPAFLADYGLVFNGDFFQLWRRVDGLIIPMTSIQKVTKTSLPKLIKELATCLKSPPSALVAALWNRKGGVAKTTSTINIAACLALEGKRVLLVDLDPQNDLTTGIGLQANFAPNYFDIAYEKLQLQELESARDIITNSIQVKSFTTTEKKKFNLSLLSSDRKHLNSILDRTYAHSPQVTFNQILKLLRYEYDYIFIDCSPKQDKLAECLLCTAEVMILPIDDDCKALNHAIEIVKEHMPIVRSMRNKSDAFTLGPWHLGLVSSKCPANLGTGLEKAIDNFLKSKDFTGKQIGIRLVSNDYTKQASFRSLPVVCAYPNSAISQAYLKLTQTVFLGHNYSID